MIFLFGVTHLNIRQHYHSRGEVYFGVRVNASNLLEDVSVLAVELLEIFLNGVETVAHIIFISVST